MMLLKKILFQSCQVLLPAFFLPLFLFGQNVEDCTNGQDDDGDGLIDCFDPDCHCTGPCEDFYYTTCGATCSYVPPCGTLSLGVQWTSEAETGTFSVLVAGDMDADGIPDVVTYKTDGQEIYIIDGATGLTKQTIISPVLLPGGTAPAIADLDHDGFGEVVIVGNDRRLRCWNHDGSLAWQSNGVVGYSIRYRYCVPNIADFDHNGWAEINIGNQVFNGQNGSLMATGGSNRSAGEHPARVDDFFSFNMPVAIDALPDNFCPDCDGLEIVAGNQVFSVNFTSGAATLRTSAPPEFSDGYTSVVDFDRDGDLDAIVQGQKSGENTVYVWDILTGTVLREFKLYNNNSDGASRVNVADLDADGELEINFISYPWIYTLDNNFDTLWTRPTTDLSSITSSSVFDFCGDGSADVIYRGQTHLQVLNGATGQVSWEDACVSATHIENPLVLDVDGDGQTEIVIQCGTSDIWGPGNVLVYEAVGSPGIASRRVWNQHAYINTNINDDLSVPVRQQNPHLIGDGLKLNTFLNQFFDPLFPSPDGVLNLESLICRGDSMEIRVSLCNAGDNVLPVQTPLSLYKGNPQTSAGQWLVTFPLDAALFSDSCRIITLTLPTIANDSLFLVVNDDHSLATPYSLATDFPVTTLGECSFLNNVAGIYLSYSPPIIDLGPDTAVCNGATVLLNAGGQDLAGWSWTGGQTDSTFLVVQSGSYQVVVTDVCGVVQTDRIKITIAPDLSVDLGPDQFLCAGDQVSFSQPGFDLYSWHPSGFVNCDTCPQVIVIPDSSSSFVLTGRFDNGCFSRDTVYFTVYDTFNYIVDTVVCFGRDVEWNSQTLLPGESRIFDLKTVHGCDSIVRVNVIGTSVGTFQIQIDTALCLGDILTMNGTDILPGQQKTFNLSAITGCDSVVQVKTAVKDTFYTVQNLALCSGDTAVVFGMPKINSGVFKQVFKAVNGCDSTHLVNLTVFDPIEITISGAMTCPNEYTGSLTAVVSGTAPPFQYTWNIPSQKGASIQNLAAGDYSLTVTDARDCSATIASEVEAYPPLEFSVSVDSVTCYGQDNGAVAITSLDSTVLFSFDGLPFSRQLKFESLAAGNYTVLAQDIFGCTDTVGAPVFQPLELVLSIPADTTLTLGDSIQIRTFSSGAKPLSFQWSGTGTLTCDTCPAPWVRPIQTAVYALLVTDANGCTVTGQIMYEVRRLIEWYVPNAFKPDASNYENSLFEPIFGSAIERIIAFRVFDRWGNLIHQVENAAPGAEANAWDGFWRGKTADSGVYVWFLEVGLVDGSREQFRGEVTLIR